jgi:hypothetical protein
MTESEEQNVAKSRMYWSTAAREFITLLINPSILECTFLIALSGNPFKSGKNIGCPATV